MAGKEKHDSGITLRNVLCGHEGVVSHMAWAPAGNALASCSLDQTLRLWDREGERAEKIIRAHDVNVTGLAWAPKAQALATVSDDRRILLWTYPEGKSLGGLEGHDHGNCQARWSPNGDVLVTAGNGRAALVWDVVNTKLRSGLSGHRGILRGIEFSPDGATLATFSEDRQIRLWDGERFTPLGLLKGHEGAVNDAVWMPDGRLISVGDEGSVRVWDVERERCVAHLQAHLGPVKAVALAPRGRLMATRSWDQTLRIWRTDTWRDVLVIEEPTASPFPTLAFHHSLPVLASVGAIDRLIRIWELNTRQLAKANPSEETLSFLTEEAALLIQRGYGHLAQARRLTPKGSRHIDPRKAPVLKTPTTHFQQLDHAAYGRAPAPTPQAEALPKAAEGKGHFLCPNCREPITESQSQRRLAAGHRFLRCPVCDFNVPLVQGGDKAVPSAVQQTPTVNAQGLRAWVGGDKAVLALLFTDIVGSTDLATRIGDGEMKTIRRAHFKRARKIIADNQGFEIKTMGDSFMVAFKSVRAGFDCALQMNGDTGHGEIAIRAGLHVGEVEIEENDAFGLMVNFCARILSMADGPEIWLSEPAWKTLLEEDAQRYAELPWTYTENVTLKGFPGTYKLWAL